MRKISLFAFELNPGMVTAEDVFTGTGQMLVPADTTLDAEIIERFHSYNITMISVYEEAPDAQVTAESTYSERIKASPEFQSFKANYLEQIDTFQNALSDVVLKNDAIPMTQLLNQTAALLEDHTTSLQVFDMLHNLRGLDDSTFAHCLNVSLICRVFGQWLNMSAEDIDALTLAGLLHDVGKLATPEDILTKPGKLSSDEFAIMKNHATDGYNFLKPRDMDARIKAACLFHHERCDGTGYPIGLTGDKIPAFAKIVSIADVYDAMTAKRVYRGPLCPFIVLRHMENDCFTKYDPTYLLPFLGNVASTYINTTVRLSNGQIGTVVMLNNNALSRPMIHCGNEFINLIDHPDLSIESFV